MLLRINSRNASNLYFKEFMLIYANVNLFGFLSLISYKSLKLCVKELGLSELPLYLTSGQDISLFWEKWKPKRFLWRPPATCREQTFDFLNAINS